MLKLLRCDLSLLLLAAFAAMPARAAILGPDATACEPGSHGPAMLVRVGGFKARTGVVRVQSYGGRPSTYFDKGVYLKRIDVPEPTSDPAEICVAVPRPGTYAVSVRHDVNGNGKTDREDGGGMSGNPDVSLWDVIFKNKPNPSRVAVQVGEGVTSVPVVMRYVQGASFRPISGSTR